MKRQLWIAFSLSLFLGIGEVRAGAINIGPAEFVTITNSQGQSRVLFHLPVVPLAENARVERATLIVSLAGPPAEKDLTLQLHPILTPWNAGSVTWDLGWNTPGGDIDTEIYTRAEVELANGNATFGIDVTHLFKEILEEGLVAYGLLVTVPPYLGEGFQAADLPWVAGLAMSTLDLETRVYSPPPPSTRCRRIRLISSAPVRG